MTKTEIFCGTGGVGKTTLSTSRALYLAKNNLNVLVITIDPANRLKQLLDIDNHKMGETNQISWENVNFDALCLDPSVTFTRTLSSLESNQDILNNPIVMALIDQRGGMNELMGILELQYHVNSKKYDVIVLDTPPGSHFLDFLDSCNRINTFFDSSFVEIFQYLGSKSPISKNKNILRQIIGSGVKKLLSYLEKVTSQDFLFNFIDAIASIYKYKSVFIEAIKFEDTLKNPNSSKWYLVTSTEQFKTAQALEMKNQASHFFNSTSSIVINKCLDENFKSWNPESEQLQQIKKTLIQKEEKIIDTFNTTINIHRFPDLSGIELKDQVLCLASGWKE